MCSSVKIHYAQNGDDDGDGPQGHRASPNPQGVFLLLRSPARPCARIRPEHRDPRHRTHRPRRGPLIFLVLFLLFRNVRRVPDSSSCHSAWCHFCDGPSSLSRPGSRRSSCSFPRSSRARASAWGIHYSVFMLSRFQEERRPGCLPYAATEIMVKHAGFTILASALTLGTAFLGLVFFPDQPDKLHRFGHRA